MMKIQILIFNGFDELDAIAPFEVFQSAAAMGIDVRAELVTLDDPVEIIAAHGLRIVPNAKLERDRNRRKVNMMQALTLQRLADTDGKTIRI